MAAPAESIDECLEWEVCGNIGGTSNQGSIEATYDQLVAVFGDPLNGPDDVEGDKVSCEWDMKFKDGTIATIYDYKEGGVTPRGLYDWSIGGKSFKAVSLVRRVFELGR